MRYSARARMIFGVLIVFTVVAGLLTRAAKPRFPFAADAAGDALWATMAFFLISFAFPTVPLWKRAAAAIAVSFAVEFSQLYHARWIDRIRARKLGAMVLGSTFVATDLLCYVAGVAVGVAIERVSLWRK